MPDRLRRYRSKRDPAGTTEPGVRDQGAALLARDSAPRFVIQKHAASRDWLKLKCEQGRNW
ncbi:MAG: hypothetical protein ACR2JH_00395 [Solirubrobacteraceae bacterium]